MHLVRPSWIALGALSVLAVQPSRVRAQAASAAPPPELHFRGEAVELGGTFQGGRFVVETRIGDAGPYHFFIDTGASASVIDADLADALDLEVTGAMGVEAPGGPRQESNRVFVPTLTVGGLEVTGMSPVALELRALTGGVLDGVLGMDLFGEVLLTLDPRRQRAIVSRGSLEAGRPGVIPIEDGPRLVFDVDIAGRRVPMQIDTGAPDGFTLPVELMDSLPQVDGVEQTRAARLVGGERTLHVRQLDGTVRFADLEYDAPEIIFMEPSPPIGNVGSAVLDDLTLTVDLSDGLIRLTGADEVGATPPDPPFPLGPPSGTSPPAPPEPRAESAPGAPRRLGVQFRGAPGVGLSEVAAVDPGSLGEQVGFRAGDVLISLNGRPMSEYDPAALGALIRGSERLVWEIERAGERRTIEVRGGG